MAVQIHAEDEKVTGCIDRKGLWSYYASDVDITRRHGLVREENLSGWMHMPKAKSK